jgi:hypothetical protein
MDATAALPASSSRLLAVGPVGADPDDLHRRDPELVQPAQHPVLLTGGVLGSSSTATTCPATATNRTTGREHPRCGISTIRSSVHCASGSSQGSESRSVAAAVEGLKTRRIRHLRVL